jgi:hypothetical protein
MTQHRIAWIPGFCPIGDASGVSRKRSIKKFGLLDRVLCSLSLTLRHFLIEWEGIARDLGCGPNLQVRLHHFSFPLSQYFTWKHWVIGITKEIALITDYLELNQAQCRLKGLKKND